MEKGYSIVVTSTDSSVSKYVFISKKWFKIILAIILLVAIIVVIAVANYSRVSYQALEAVLLKRRSAEIEREFEKLQEIKRNLEIAEMNNRKLRIMLGIEKNPTEVEPVINETSSGYSERINMMVNDHENVPSLLPAMGRISRRFTSGHKGIDFAAPRFSPVVAAASGVIRATGWDAIYGNYVIIDHTVNYATFYGHLNSINVKKDNKVNCGAVIGTVGSTGKSTSPHLHYEVRFRQESVDPTGYLPLVLNLKE
jgi:murein DD-endopeptidase MepM/ murein hydrolase activator NlpD